MKLFFLFLHLLLLWTFIFTYAQMVSYFSFITFLILRKNVVSDIKLVFLSPLATFVNWCIRFSVGKLLLHHLITFIILTKSVVSDMKFVSLHLLLLWTCIFTYAQMVSYFLVITFLILIKSVVSNMKLVFLSPLATFVNLCICFSSAGKLLFITS